MASLEEETQQQCSNCRKQFPISKINSHEAYCARNFRKCQDCTMLVDKNEIEEHREEFHSKISCAKCGLNQPTKAALAKHEDSECRLRPRNCPYCNVTVANTDFDDHRNSCGSRTKQCGLCNKNILVRSYDDHIETCVGIDSEAEIQKQQADQKSQIKLEKQRKQTAQLMSQFDNQSQPQPQRSQPQQPQSLRPQQPLISKEPTMPSSSSRVTVQPLPNTSTRTPAQQITANTRAPVQQPAAPSLNSRTPATAVNLTGISSRPLSGITSEQRKPISNSGPAASSQPSSGLPRQSVSKPIQSSVPSYTPSSYTNPPPSLSAQQPPVPSSSVPYARIDFPTSSNPSNSHPSRPSQVPSSSSSRAQAPISNPSTRGSVISSNEEGSAASLGMKRDQYDKLAQQNELPTSSYYDNLQTKKYTTGLAGSSNPRPSLTSGATASSSANTGSGGGTGGAAYRSSAATAAINSSKGGSSSNYPSSQPIKATESFQPSSQYSNGYPATGMSTGVNNNGLSGQAYNKYSTSSQKPDLSMPTRDYLGSGSISSSASNPIRSDYQTSAVSSGSSAAVNGGRGPTYGSSSSSSSYTSSQTTKQPIFPSSSGSSQSSTVSQRPTSSRGTAIQAASASALNNIPGGKSSYPSSSSQQPPISQQLPPYAPHQSSYQPRPPSGGTKLMKNQSSLAAEDEDRDLQRAMLESINTSKKPAASGSSSNNTYSQKGGGGFTAQYDEDEDLAQAIKLSQQFK